MSSRKEHTIYMRIWRKNHPTYYKSLKWKKYKSNWVRIKREEDKEFYRTELLKHRIWMKKNRKNQNKYKNEYEIFRRKLDASYKLICYYRSRISNALKRNLKSVHTLELLGCSIPFLRQYLESKFKPDMSWSNYGAWHVDHIKSCNSFDLSKPEEQRKCFHYTNLQPLWASENLAKGRL